MQAYLIDAEKKSIENIDIQNRDDIIRIIGYDTLESDAIGSTGDRLFFDEECFLRGSAGRFQIDTVIPVSGKAVLIGTMDDGRSYADVTTTLDDLKNRIKYL